MMLAIFVLRIGVVTACAPNDVTEVLKGDSGISALHSDAHDDSSPDHEDDPASSDGHCLHCSCHHAVALPRGLLPLPAVTLESYTDATPRAQLTSPPDLSLRPPIV